MKRKTISSAMCLTVAAAMALNMSACGQSAESAGCSETVTEEAPSEKQSDKDEKNKEEAKEAKEPVAEKADDAQSAEDFDLYSALAGEDFELSSVNTYDSNYRTWIKFKEDGSFSGSFIKDYYVESADGQADGQADGSFTGKLGKCTQVDQYTWKADIEELTYDVSADVPKEYSSASGLEGYDNGSTEMTFHLPGKDVEALPGDVSSWLFGNDFGAYVGYDMDWVLDTPLDLPFYVVSTKDGCFSGRNVSGKNELCIINKAKLPGFINQELTINPDGTYTCIDADENGNIKFTNTCFEYNGFDVDVEECIKKIYGNIDYEYISIYGNGGENDEDEWIYKPDWKWLNGMKSKYAFWSVGENDNYVFYQGRFVSPYIDDGRYVFAYILEYHGAGKAVDAETASMALGSLSFSGRKDELSCAGVTAGQPYTELLIECIKGQGRSILGDEVEFVHEGETEKIEKYGLDPNAFYDDYQIGGYDGKFEEFELANQCPIYTQYAPDGLHRLLTLEEFNSYVPANDQDGSRLMNIVLDKDGKVILISEPYTP
ncbi:hypothetical protein [Butyrivibrio sp. LC3010]|uniref:hypothetical protein n=1 Tax=Butyrivibrio sp. LC3010 TaxID=1280680 RepID=UPI00041496AE|nr:hypothetical protein [Butyrivibrio sp. LC3010]